MEYVTLMGAEQVQSAGRTIANAADRMCNAASSMDDTFRQQRQFLDDWMTRFEAAVASLNAKEV